jgi:hypothetical protein
MTESSFNSLYNALMRVTHRDLESLRVEFDQFLNQQGLMGAKALVFIALNSKINDQVMAAILVLLQSDDSEYRAAGRALLLGSDVYVIEPYDYISGIDPFRVFRILDFITKSPKPITRQTKAIVTHWLNALEKDPDRLDSIAVLNRKAFKWMLKYWKLRHTEYTNSLFFGDPPENSKIGAIKKIAAATSITEKAKMIVESRIPFRIASSLLPKIDASVGIILLQSMSPTEALNSTRWLEASGVLNIPEVKAAYLKKIEKATKSAASIDLRRSVKSNDADINAAQEKAKNKAAESGVRVSGDVLVVIDGSGSQEDGIAISAKIVPHLISAVDGEVLPIIYNNTAMVIDLGSDRSLTGVQRTFSRLRASGGTDMKRALDKATQRGFPLQKIVWVGDLCESDPTGVVRALAAYEDKPDLLVIQMQSKGNAGMPPPTPNLNLAMLEATGCRVELIDMRSRAFDPYILDNVRIFLAGGGKRSMMDTIADIVLPHIVAVR